MVNSKILILFFALILTISCKSQIVKDQILGKWEAKKEVVDGIDNKTIDGKNLETNFSLIFFEKRLNVNENGIIYEDIPYKLKKEKKQLVLSFGNRKYIIEKLNSREMILLEDIFLASRIFFIKVTQ